MTNPIDRRDLLTSTVTAWAAVVIGCSSDDSDGGGTGGTSGGTGGTGGTMAGSGGAPLGGSGGSSAGMTAAGTGPAGMPGAGAGGNAGVSGSGAGGAGQSGSAGAGAGGMSGAGAGGMNGGMAGGGAGGMSMSGGDAGMGGTSFTCSTDTSNGDHSHPLTVPGSDVERGYQDAPYPLEDGGTGHKHELTLTSYDFVYLAAGAMAIRESTETNMHTHMCKITCAIG